MGKITAISAGRRQGKRVNIFLDGRFAFSLEADVAEQEKLEVEQTLSAEQVEALTRSDQQQRCYNAASRYLSYRPQSESEIRQKLTRRGFDNMSVEATIARLKDVGLIDDFAFAQFWKDSREMFNPRSRWMTKLELKQKGLSQDIADQVVGTIDDSDSAYRAALGKVRSLACADYEIFRRRLGGYLRRRGFSYGVINHTVERLWKDRGSVQDAPLD